MRITLALSCILLAITLSFQACSKPVTFTPGETALKGQQNGEGYFGKPTPYEFVNAVQTCRDVGANGKPLPNRQIFLFANGLAQLVRENCADIPPQPLAAEDYTVDGNGRLTYQNQTFAINSNQGAFDVVAASCPTGRTQLASPIRSSYFLDSLDLLSPNWWDTKATTVTLEGSLGSLPLFKVARLDPNALDSWRRIAQNPYLDAGETYVYSFYIKPDSTQRARFMSYIPNGQDLTVDFDSTTGAATIVTTNGAQVIETKATPFAGGMYINLYFKSLVTMQVNMGLGSASSALGAAIFTTAHQLEKVSNYCAP